MTGLNDLPHATVYGSAVSSSLPNLVTRGQFFGLENGKRWTAIQASDFNLLARWLRGEDIAPVLLQRSACGFNLLRVWTLFDVPGIGRLIPSEHADFYARATSFLHVCALYGLRVEFTVFTGARRLMPKREDQQSHLDRMCDAVRAFDAI